MRLSRHRKHPDRWYVEIEVPASEGAEAVNASTLDTLAPHSEALVGREDVADDSCVACFEWALEPPEGVTQRAYRDTRRIESGRLVRSVRDRMQASEQIGEKQPDEGEQL
ncbi:MAG: hypothetical protein ACR2ML_01075 [Solirubrobacteraceae bacterium]